MPAQLQQPGLPARRPCLRRASDGRDLLFLSHGRRRTSVSAMVAASPVHSHALPSCWRHHCAACTCAER
eukprot:9463388-Prorocentrum_lima.AAC.1